MASTRTAAGPRPPEVKFCAMALEEVNLDGVFEGYASLFHREDLGRDIVLPGAFRDSLRTRGAGGVKMLFQQDPNQPIGIWHWVYEDARGLFARGRIMTEIPKGREVLTMMRAGAIDGLSIGFRVVNGVRDRRTGVRRLRAIDLWEISVVTFPMLPGARVAAVKARAPTRCARSPRERRYRPRCDGANVASWRQHLANKIAESARLMRKLNGEERSRRW